MLLFIKCSREEARDEIVARLNTAEGVVWSDYKAKVKGYSLDAEVKFIRLCGVSPETSELDNKNGLYSLKVESSVVGSAAVVTTLVINARTTPKLLMK